MGVRFAPSPTGRLHIGNLRTAWISHWWSKSLGLKWVLRFEDIDKPRNVSGSQEQQLSNLEQLGLIPDEIIVQSQNFERHWQIFVKGVESHKFYPCFCSRKDLIETLASAPHSKPPTYSG